MFVPAQRTHIIKHKTPFITVLNANNKVRRSSKAQEWVMQTHTKDEL
jgi:hypothetical protein